MGFKVPVGFDTADGKTPIPDQPFGSGGTPSPVGTPIPGGDENSYSNASDGQTPTVEGAADSPTVERAEQGTFESKISASWEACLNFITGFGRGTFVQDSFGNIWRILSSKIQRFRSGQKMGQLSLVGESISFDSPPDDFQCTPVELGINIIKHPRYFPFLNPTGDDFTTVVGVAPNTATVAQIKQWIIRAIQTYQDAPWFPTVSNVNSLIQNNVITSLTSNKISPNDNGTQVDISGSTECRFAVQAAGEIIQKLWRLEENPYIVGYEIKWSQYFFTPVYVNPGGYLESPAGIVPDYFLSPSQDGSNTIFDLMAQINPQSYSSDGTSVGSVDFSCLRKADEIDFQRTWFKVTHTWLLIPIGSFDADLYTQNDRPSQLIQDTQSSDWGRLSFRPLASL